MNVNDVIILDEAVEDLESGKSFYDDREFGIGDYFVDCILSDLTSLKLYAGVHHIHLGFQRMLSKRFPFAIYYYIENHIAHVVAILDMRMNPDSIQKALNHRK